MVKISSELILGVSTLAIGGAALYLARDYSVLAAIMPRAVSIILLVFGCILLGQSLQARRRDGSQGDAFAVILTITVIAVYIWLLPRLGYIISSILMFTLMSILLESSTRSVRLLGVAFVSAVGVTGITYVIFDYALLVPLPRGNFF